jgi:DNA polymerase I-like protein with 3'-5' exonuclease and polymerase domains
MSQLPLFRPKELSAWSPPRLSDLPTWSGVKRLGLDIETRDDSLKALGPGVRRGGYIVGVSFAIEDGKSFYLPVRHLEDSLAPEDVFSWLREQAASFTGVLVGANLQYDLDYLAQEGVTFPKAQWFRDIQIADPLINELEMSYSLDSISSRHGLPAKNEVVLRDAAQAWGIREKHDLWKLPARYVADYAEFDARLPLLILRRQERVIEEQGLQGIFDLESRVMPILLGMRRQGVLIDQGHLAHVEKWGEAETEKALREVYRLTGYSLRWDEVWKPKAVAAPLEAAGITLKKTKTGQPQLDNLKTLKDPVSLAMNRARAMNKVVTTFCASIRRHMVNGRVHASFHQLRSGSDDEDDQGARYGRLSSTDPNLQQQPARHEEIGPLWRKCYLPDEGKIWAALDYSQQEPRLLYHYAANCKLPRADQVVAAYLADAATDSHTMMAKMCGISRSKAKPIFLGKCYGMGGAKLCRTLGLPTATIFSQRLQKDIDVAGEEGQAILNQFDRELPFVSMLSRLCEERAGSVGFIKTLLGRRCRFPMGKDGRYQFTHKALNRLIQGSAADQTKLAMVELVKAGFRPQLQVHDEIDASVSNREEAVEMARIMETCVSLKIPSKVDVEVGPNWGEAE